MDFLTPLGFGLTALAIPIIILYMLKLRRKQVQVSSTLLWERLLRDQQANAPWQRLRRNLLLYLQLLILAALVLAIARPAVQTPVVASGAVIVLLDGSASMNATDVSPSRFDAARNDVITLIDGMPGGSRMTVILVNNLPHTLITTETDKSALKRALAAAQPSQGTADWQSAFALAAGAAQGSQQVTNLIVSDGGLPESGLPSLPGDVRYLPVGTAADNLAISALALRPAAQGPELFAKVTNYSQTERTTLLSIYLGSGLISARSLTMKAGSSASLTLDNLPATPGIYKARISNPQDGTALDTFPLDDTAFAIYQASTSRRVLLVSKGNLFLEQLLASLPGIQPFRALPDKDGNLQIPNAPFDLTVLDGIVPAELPPGNLLFVDPPEGGNALFQVGAPFKDMKNVQVHEDPLTRFVDWSNVHVLQAQSIQLPQWARVLVGSDAGPLVFTGTTGNRRVAVVSFDLRQSDLPLQVAYPILFSNLINDLVPPGAFDATQPLRPGEVLNMAAQPGVDQVVVATPSGQAFPVAPGAAGYSFAETNQLGYYAATFISKGSSKVEYFAVNLFDPFESEIHTRATIKVGATAIRAGKADAAGQLELWPWLATVALLILLIEWQAYHSRGALLASPKNLLARFLREGRRGGL